MLGRPAHELRRKAADRRTLIVQFDAPSHHLGIRLLKAGRSAGVARLRAFKTRLDARLKLIFDHDLLLECR